MMRSAGFDAGGPVETSGVSSLDGALRYLDRHDVASVVLDLGLPDACGLDALAAILAARPALAVVVLTGDEDLGLRAVAAGAQDYLLKGTVTAGLVVKALRCAMERAAAGQRAEAELRERKKRLDEGERLAHLGSWSFDARSGKRVWSDERFRLLGYEPGAFEPDVDHYLDRIHPDDVGWIRDIILANGTRTTPSENEFRVLLPDGTVRWMAARSEPIYDELGNVVGLHGTTQDVTWRKAAEEQLRFQAHLLDAVAEAVVATDLSGNVIYWGPGAEALYGWTASEAVGHDVTDFIPEVGPPAAAGVERYPARGEIWTGIVPRRRRDGSLFMAEVTDTPVFDEAGHMVAIIGISTDVSEREQARADLERARDQALEASLLKSQFLANMSHEIRTPMNGILGMTELLLDTMLDSGQREYVETARASGDALLAIINDILDLSKIEAGGLHLESVDFDLAAVVSDVGDLLAGAAQRKNLELVIDVGDDVTWVRGDPTRVRQVLTNLAGNAVKFTSAGQVVVSAVVLDTSESDVALRLQVEDSGIGIDTDQAAHIFEPFAQADSSTTRRYGGTGLGLTITRELIDRMGGSCGVQSQAGVGSTFWCTLRLGRPGEHAPVQAPPADHALDGRRALVVDDNAASSAVLARHLTGCGASVEIASSGAAALDAARAATAAGAPFAVVFSDVGMPGMGGRELATALAEEAGTAATPLVLLTSSGDPREVGDSFPANVRALLAKPVRRERLRACIAGLVQHDAGTRPATPGSGGCALEEQADGPVRGAVLLAEDNLVNRKVAMAMLQSGGYRVDVASDGLEALRATRDRHYDVVLMDCQMPRMDGYEAAAAIRAEEDPGRRVPIVALTAGAMQEDRERALAAGMDDHLTKPVKKADVLAAVGRWATAG